MGLGLLHKSPKVPFYLFYYFFKMKVADCVCCFLGDGRGQGRDREGGGGSPGAAGSCLCPLSQDQQHGGVSPQWAIRWGAPGWLSGRLNVPGGTDAGTQLNPANLPGWPERLPPQISAAPRGGRKQGRGVGLMVWALSGELRPIIPPLPCGAHAPLSSQSPPQSPHSKEPSHRLGLPKHSVTGKFSYRANWLLFVIRALGQLPFCRTQCELPPGKAVQWVENKEIEQKEKHGPVCTNLVHGLPREPWWLTPVTLGYFFREKKEKGVSYHTDPGRQESALFRGEETTHQPP